MVKKAFILIDIQNDYFAGGKLPLVGIDEASVNSAKLLSQIRQNQSLQNDYLIIHVRHENSDAVPFFNKGTSGAEIHETVKAEGNETVITKHHPNSFIETNLQQVLDEHKIKDIILVGAMTNMCIQGTARGGQELGYNVTVVKDAVATRDQEFDGKTVTAKDAETVVFATLALWGYAALPSTQEVSASL